jgi:hypothetical protein
MQRVQDTANVDINHLLPVAECRFFERGENAEACIGNADIETTPLLDRGRHSLAHCCFIGNVNLSESHELAGTFRCDILEGFYIARQQSDPMAR